MVYPFKLKGCSFYLFIYFIFNENVSQLEVDLSTQKFIAGGETSTLS